MTARIISSLLLLTALLLPAGAAAQKNIEKIVDSLESSKIVSNVMYRETRDPSTHKLVSSLRILQFSDSKTVDKILEAFSKDRPKAITYTVQDTPKKVSCEIAFYDGSSHHSRYVLKGFRDGTMTIMLRHDYINRYPANTSQH